MLGTIKYSSKVSTLASEIIDDSDFKNENIVKVITKDQLILNNLLRLNLMLSQMHLPHLFDF